MNYIFKTLTLTILMVLFFTWFQFSSNLSMSDLDEKEESLPNETINKIKDSKGVIKGSVNDELYKEIEEVLNGSIPSKKLHTICLKLSNEFNIKEDFGNKMVSALSKCRGIRNQYGVTKKYINEIKMIVDLLKNQGWQYVINKIENGEISAQSSLQSKEFPMHNLLDTFTGAGVKNIEAYEKLISYGVKPNAMFLSLSFIKKRKDLIKLYERHVDIFSLNDMQQNIVYSAAAFGSLSDMDYFLDKGVPYEDILGRDPLEKQLTRFSFKVSKKVLKKFIEKHNINLTDHHLQAVIKGGSSLELFEFVKEQLPQ